jgi:hypothetical protein
MRFGKDLTLVAWPLLTRVVFAQPATSDITIRIAMVNRFIVGFMPLLFNFFFLWLYTCLISRV